ncbi:DNA cytosine methyltransferase [Afifella sp. IM 167]|uniref:DNA cytosine methyltransferase n=1 Tax=Afifella sp. IM 167 TaxID=2033586 RepID=UPI001CC9C883|nr:DNA cytosine methyltransferase [Afifella sp. IM 167]MBZ8133247.1 DNA (cytosine-5-)-methyltransferase [Afifella sp. IM 167]
MRELIVDSFAGGGGASTGIEMALGRSPDYAINHDAEALAMHAINHPDCVHLSKDIWQVCPFDVVGRRPVGLLWASPDCKHFSKAKGGKPRERNIRDLAWVVVRWAEEVRPRVIILENVEEFRTWGPLYEDGTPIRELAGHTFEHWLKRLRTAGYKAEWRELRACDHGAPTIRKRFFLIARRDGRKICWSKPTHGAPDDPAVLAGRKKPWRTAAEIIDFSLPCPSIFMSREEAKAFHAATGIRVNRPLAENTMARIARGVQRYVIEAAEPFVVKNMTNNTARRVDAPVSTVLTGNHHMLVTPFVSYAQQGGASRAADAPLHTVTASAKDANQVVAVFLAQHNGGMTGHGAGEPVSTITQRGANQALVTAEMVSAGLRGAMQEARRSISPTGTHRDQVRAFLIKYFGTAVGQELSEPLHTATAKPRFGLVTIEGAEHEIVDIGMRMLTPRELFRAQGFPDSYVIDRGLFRDAGGGAEERPLTATAAIRMCGNAVPPPPAGALVAANCADMAVKKEGAAEEEVAA